MSIKNTKIALVHDWLLGVGGAEKTLKVLHEIFPEAPIYTLFHDKKFADEFLPGADIRSTFLQRPYNLLQGHKLLAPLFPVAAESIDLSDFELVISSSVAFSKGLILKPQTKHVCYCYSPMRQVWDWHSEYKNESGFPLVITSLLQHLMRIWDRQASTRMDHFMAISENVRQRIAKYYRRDAVVIYPPVNRKNTGYYHLVASGYFLIISRLFKHKNIDIAVEAFNKLGFPLVIIGDGPELKSLRKISGPNVQVLGYQPDDKVSAYLAGCAAFIMPQEEDFGIAPIEAMAYGKPVLALRRGGALEYIEEGINGEFFGDPVEAVLADGVRRIKEGIDKQKYDLEKTKRTAGRFSVERFKDQLISYLTAIPGILDQTKT